LQIVIGLKTLVLSSQLVVVGDGKDETVLQGWSRTRTTSNGNHGETNGISLICEEGIGAFRLPLYPLAVAKPGAVLLWNSVRGDGIEYIDYGSGKLERFVLESTNPYDLWMAQRAASG